MCEYWLYVVFTKSEQWPQNTNGDEVLDRDTCRHVSSQVSLIFRCHTTIAKEVSFVEKASLSDLVYKENVS